MKRVMLLFSLLIWIVTVGISEPCNKFPINVVFSEPVISNYNNLIYNIKMINITENQVKSVKLDIIIPRELIFIDIRENLYFNVIENEKGKLVSFNIGDLQSYQQIPIRLRMKYTELILPKDSPSNSIIDLELSMPRLMHLNRTIHCNIMIRNRGDKTVNNLIVKNVFPDNLIVLSALPNGICQIVNYKPIAVVTWGENNYKSSFLPEEGKKLTIVTWKIKKLLPCSEKSVKIECKIVKGGFFRNLVLIQENGKIISHSLVNSTILCSLDMDLGVDHIIKDNEIIYLITCVNRFDNLLTNVTLEHTIITNNLELIKIQAPVDYKVLDNRLIFDPYPVLRQENILQFQVIYKIKSNGYTESRTILSWDEADTEIPIEKSLVITDFH